MAIANFGDLKTAMASWLNRSDLTSSLPDFISFAASRIYYGSDDELLPSPPVRTWSMQAVSTPAVTSNTFALPTRYLATIMLMSDAGAQGTPLQYISPSQWAKFSINSDQAGSYTILNNTGYLSGSGAQTITHHYYQSFAAFSADADTNALLTAAPNLWLYGALLEAYVFNEADEQTKKYHRLFRGMATALNRVAKEHGGGTLAVRAG